MGPMSIRFLLEKSHGAAFSVLDFRAPPGFVGPPVPHHHTREEASFLVLEGALTVTVDGTPHEVGPGGFVHLPPRVDFTWKNARSDAPARFLCIYAPAGFEEMFLDSERTFAARGGAPTPETIREVMPSIWQKYGIEVARP